MTCHSKRSRGLPFMTTWEKNSEWANMAARTSTTTAATQRPGWRTGTTGSSGRGWVPWPAEDIGLQGGGSPWCQAGWLAGRAVDDRVGDGTLLHPPLVQDLLVLAVGHDGLHGLQQRLGQPAALGHDEAVGSGLEGLAGQLELPMGLVHDPRRHLGVGKADVGPVTGDGQVGLVLVVEALHVDVAALGLGHGVALLGGAGLDRDRVAAQRAEAVEGGLAVGQLIETFAGAEVVDEVDLLLPGLGIGERRVAEVVLAALNAGDDGVEGGVDQLHLDAHGLAERLGKVRVEPDDVATLDE